MERPTRTVECPHCGAAKQTRAFGGVALRCSAEGCGRLFTCPAKERTGRRAKATSKPAAKPAQEPAPASGGVKVKRAKGVKATAPAPPDDPPAQDDPAPPKPRPTRTRPKSHRRSWGGR